MLGMMVSVLALPASMAVAAVFSILLAQGALSLLA
jgi:hypothetical protein